MNIISEISLYKTVRVYGPEIELRLDNNIECGFIDFTITVSCKFRFFIFCVRHFQFTYLKYVKNIYSVQNLRENPICK